VLRPALAFLLLLAACADDPAPGAPSPCDTPAGPLLSCPGEAVSPAPFTIEDACARLVECGLFAVNHVDADGNHHDDYRTCVKGLRDDDYQVERLAFVLACVDVATCEQLANEHCGRFGGEVP
jgi:hypothetical protein